MKNVILAIIFNLYCFISFSNSASPYIEGTRTSTILSTKDLRILNEKIYIQPNTSFTKTNYEIEYLISSYSNLKSIPILFVALDYLGEFEVSLDGKKIGITPFNEDSLKNKEYCNRLFGSITTYDSLNMGVNVKFGKFDSQNYQLKDLKYYTINLSKGNHILKVSYRAKKSIDLSEKIKIHRFIYSLYPAIFWKSFGRLEVILDLTKCYKELKCNLGKIRLNKNRKASWKFDKLPKENIILSYQSKPNYWASFFLKIGVTPIGLFFSIILMLFHLYIIRWFTRKNLSVLTFLSTYLGVLFVPFLFIWCFIYAEDIIDFSIGSEASGRGSAYYLIFILPLIYIAYFILLTIYYIAQKNKIE